MPHSMHRDACSLTCSGGACSTISFQSWTRSSTDRSSSSTRGTFRKPLGSPMTAGHLGRDSTRSLLECSTPLVRHHLHESPLERAREQVRRVRAARMGDVLLNQRADDLLVFRRERLEIDRRLAATSRKQSVIVEYVRGSPAHSRGEVATGRSENDDDPPRHVLAAVVSDPLDDG